MIKKLLPPSLNQKPFKEIAEALDIQLQKVWEELVNVLIYPRIDEIEDEELLDLLGWQFHIEGWELAKTIEEKRRLVKSAIELHRYKGTPYAIKKVLEALGLVGEVKEWFQYGGKPYRFKIDLSSVNREITPGLRDKLIELINEYKNERSWLEEIALSYLARGSVYWAAGNLGEQTALTEFQKEFTQVALGTTYWTAGSLGEQSATGRFEQ